MPPPDVDSAQAGLRKLPEGKLLVALKEMVWVQLQQRGLTPDDEDYYPALWLLWVEARAVAMTPRFRTHPSSVELLAEWGVIDRTFGDPAWDDWKMYHREAMDRYDAIVRFLANSGAMDVGSGEVDSPKHYVTKREADIARGGA